MTCRLCPSPVWAKHLCSKHYQQVRAGNSVSVVVDGELAMAAEARGMTAKQFVAAAVVKALDEVATKRGAA